MNTTTPTEQYQQQLDLLIKQLQKQEKRRKNLGWLRFAVFVLTVAAAYYVFTTVGLAGFIPTVGGLALLLYLVSLDVANNREIRNTRTLIRINEEELKALAHQFGDREDGSEFTPSEHAYATDLDIFGKASIYQWLNRGYTQQGRQLLAGNLLAPLPATLVQHRQQAVKELASNLAWRQQWQAFAMQTTITATTEKKITTWLQEKEEQFTAKGWKIFLPLYCVATLGSALATLAGYLPGSAFSSLFLLYLIVSLILSRNAIKPYIYLGGIVKETATVQSLVDWLEKLSVSAPLVKKWQTDIRGNRVNAGKEVEQLKVILDRFDLRASIVGFLFFNPFLLWDVWQIRSLNAWRQRNKHLVPKWFAALAEMEVLHSLCTLHFNHPHFCFPAMNEEHFTLYASGVGHPLLPGDQRVRNDFSVKGKGKTSLVTGSNMAGKSTFLRSLGVNTVLAQAGATVCAKSFQLSPVQVVSSMRIADNLAENTSTFYAELKKLRTIIERVKGHEKVFILLDEILRGTNSYDRHTGAAALIKQLIKEKAVAVIATHDVALAQLEKEYPEAITNYHFDVEVEGEELYFDYKLKQGVCKSLNASILMKKIGIDL